MKNQFIKERLDNFSEEVHKWELLKTSSILKPENKNTSIEMAGSYYNASKILYNAILQENHPENGVSVIRTNSLIIPFLFLCHHNIELSIKIALGRKNIKYGNIHNLKDLFLKLNVKVEQKYMDLMDTLDLIDDKGMWLRYDKDLKDKKEYVDKPYFINSKEIIKATEEFSIYLIENYNL